jgi:glutamate dehydrogenase
MIFKDGKPSPFYKAYVKDIQTLIGDNAAAEFHCIWREHARLQGAKTRTQISDELSIKLNDMQTDLESADLFDDMASRRGVMSKAIPKTLVGRVGLDVLLKRLPEPYQRALFSSWVSSRFVGHFSLSPFSLLVTTPSFFSQLTRSINMA